MENKCYCGHTTTCDCGPLEENLILIWVDFRIEQPLKEGKYIIKTQTKMGNTHKLEALCTLNKGKAHFGVSNQIVTHWLKEN